MEIVIAVLIALVIFVLFPELIIGIVKLVFWLAMAGLAIGGFLAILVIAGKI